MNGTKQTIISKDAENKKLLVERTFDAPPDLVWKAWTEKELLDQWWAPLPWKAETRSMNFSEGGTWIYCMKGPEGECSWCRADFHSIVPSKEFSATDGFCDEEGNFNSEFPLMRWNNRFIDLGDRTTVLVELSFDNEADMEKILEMGFSEGFTAAHGNLDKLLAGELVS